MGDMADYYRQSDMEVEWDSQFKQQADQKLKQERERGNLISGYWRIKEGSLIQIEQMTQQHIINALKMIEHGRIHLNYPVEWSVLLRSKIKS